MSCRPGETNLSIHCLPCKHADLSSVLESRWKQSQTSWCTLGIPAVGEESEEDPGACLSNQPSLWSEVQANTRFSINRRKQKRRAVPEEYQGVLWLHSALTYTQIHLHNCAQAHTCTCTHIQCDLSHSITLCFIWKVFY